MTHITVTHAGRLQYVSGNPYMAFAGYAVRRDGRELARFKHRDEAEAHASKIEAFIRATDAQVLAPLA